MVSLQNALLMVVAAFVSTISATCGTDHCLKACNFNPPLRKVASGFCEHFLHSTPGTFTSTRFTTIPATVTSTPTTVTVVGGTAIPSTITVIASSLCSTTTYTSQTVTTFVNYISRSSPPGALSPSEAPKPRNAVAKLDDYMEGEFNHGVEPRDVRDALVVPAIFNAGCDHRIPARARISSACKCFLTSKTVYTIATSTRTQTVTLATPTQIITITPTTQVTSKFCTSTTTITSASKFNIASCGISFDRQPVSATSGAVTCTVATEAPSPSQNIRFRIEGSQAEGTIFDDCVVAGPRDITTPSGGTHKCDGTNGGANASPGTTPTDLIDAAGRQDGFGYDGTFSSTFQDFFITSISDITQTGSQYWGVLRDLAFTARGGCQEQAVTGQTVQWIFDAFNVNAFLHIDSDWQFTQAGAPLAVKIVKYDGNGGSSSPASGATLAGQTSDETGLVHFLAPSQPGCYQYKATQAGASTSNTFYLSVVDQF